MIEKTRHDLKRILENSSEREMGLIAAFPAAALLTVGFYNAMHSLVMLSGVGPMLGHLLAFLLIYTTTLSISMILIQSVVKVGTVVFR